MIPWRAAECRWCANRYSFPQAGNAMQISCLASSVHRTAKTIRSTDYLHSNGKINTKAPSDLTSASGTYVLHFVVCSCEILSVSFSRGTIAVQRNRGIFFISPALARKKKQRKKM